MRAQWRKQDFLGNIRENATYRPIEEVIASLWNIDQEKIERGLVVGTPLVGTFQMAPVLGLLGLMTLISFGGSCVHYLAGKRDALSFGLALFYGSFLLAIEGSWAYHGRKAATFFSRCEEEDVNPFYLFLRANPTEFSGKPSIRDQIYQRDSLRFQIISYRLGLR